MSTNRGSTKEASPLQVAIRIKELQVLVADLTIVIGKIVVLGSVIQMELYRQRLPGAKLRLVEPTPLRTYSRASSVR